RHERGMYLFGDQRPSPQAKRTLAAKGEAYRALTNGQRRFAPITMTDPRDHDGPIPVITMAEMRSVSVPKPVRVNPLLDPRRWAGRGMSPRTPQLIPAGGDQQDNEWPPQGPALRTQAPRPR